MHVNLFAYMSMDYLSVDLELLKIAHALKASTFF